MTHRVWCVVVLSALLAFAPAGGNRVAGQDGGITSAVTPIGGVPAGDWFQLWVSVEGLPAGEARVLVDPLGVGTIGFVYRLLETNLWCTKPGPLPCEACPTGRRCFTNSVVQNKADGRLSPGRYTLPVSIADVAGGIRQTRASIEVRPPTDADRDGLPDGWEQTYFLAPTDPEAGADGDPDGDGVTNLEEFRRDTNPRARYYQYFAEGSSGDRPPAHGLGVLMSDADGEVGTWIRTIGDGGRRARTSWAGGGGLPPPFYQADRVVALVMETSRPVAAQRRMFYTALPVVSATRSDPRTPSSQWYFADGGTDGTLDTFFLAYNPTALPVRATITYRLADGTIARQSVRTIEPETRTTIWANVDDAALGRVEASAEVSATAPIVVERAWRFDPPGRTVTQPTATPGTATPSTRWIFPEVDAGAPFDTRLVIANVARRSAVVDVSLLYADRPAVAAGRVSIPAGGRTSIPVRQLRWLMGTRASIEISSVNGTPLIAERTFEGRDDRGAWRVATTGAPAPATRWVFPRPDAGTTTDLILTNLSAFPADVELHFEKSDSYIYDIGVSKVVTVPARGRFVYPVLRDPAFPSTPGVTRVTSRQTSRGIADIVVEAMSYDDGELGPHTRAAGILGGQIP